MISIKQRKRKCYECAYYQGACADCPKDLKVYADDEACDKFKEYG